MTALKDPRLGPLADYLKELGLDAEPAIRAWAVEHGGAISWTRRIGPWTRTRTLPGDQSVGWYRADPSSLLRPYSVALHPESSRAWNWQGPGSFWSWNYKSYSTRQEAMEAADAAALAEGYIFDPSLPDDEDEALCGSATVAPSSAEGPTGSEATEPLDYENYDVPDHDDYDDYDVPVVSRPPPSLDHRRALEARVRGRAALYRRRFRNGVLLEADEDPAFPDPVLDRRHQWGRTRSVDPPEHGAREIRICRRCGARRYLVPSSHGALWMYHDEINGLHRMTPPCQDSEDAADEP